MPVPPLLHSSAQLAVLGWQAGQVWLLQLAGPRCCGHLVDLCHLHAK